MNNKMGSIGKSGQVGDFIYAGELDESNLPPRPKLRAVGYCTNKVCINIPDEEAYAYIPRQDGSSRRKRVIGLVIEKAVTLDKKKFYCSKCRCALFWQMRPVSESYDFETIS